MAAPHNEVARYFSLVNFPAAAPAAPRPVVIMGLGRIVAVYHRSPGLYHIR